MPFTGDSLTITAEGNSSKCLLVLHKPKVGTKIGWQTGESIGAYLGAYADHFSRQCRLFKPFLRIFKMRQSVCRYLPFGAGSGAYFEVKSRVSAVPSGFEVGRF